MAKDDWYVHRFGAPYYGIHRADLQKILSGAFGMREPAPGLPAGEHRRGARRRRRWSSPNGRVERADLVVGADGVRSTVRRWVTGADDAIYSGTSAFRGIVPTENLPSLPDPHAIQFWMGPDAHLLHYAIGGDGEHVNFFAVVEAPQIWPHEASIVEVGGGRARRLVPGLASGGDRDDPGGGEPASDGALFAVRPLLRWYRGRVVLIGDAAHGMLPHHGQGANTSIEDAFVLAALLAEARRPTSSTALAQLPGTASQPARARSSAARG